MIEFEMKFSVEHDFIRQRLEQIGATLAKQDYNRDTYYNHPNRDFAETDEALRTRKNSNGIFVTYKGPKFNQQSKSREELEIGVNNGEIDLLFEKLGFSFSGHVNKERETWNYNEYTIVLDRVEHLGDFIEIEIVMVDDVDKQNGVTKLKQVAEDLGLDVKDQIIKSYLELVLEKSATSGQ